MYINPLLQTDFYKVSHYKMYPEGTTKIYSNLTPRKSRIAGIDKVVVFGIQYFLKGFMDQFAIDFLKVKSGVTNPIDRYKALIDNTLGKDSISIEHIKETMSLGYIPLKIKCLPEGSLCPIGVPMLTITNTHPSAYWLVNYLETILSCTVWQPITSATIAYEYKKLLTKWAIKTGGDLSFIPWQGHDFSMRGMSSLESACTSGAGHLLSFTGTDTIPAISFLEEYYNADCTKELVGASVPATEHSVMCMGNKDGELDTFSRLLDLYPTGILSVVSDTWNLWDVLTKFLPKLKDKILSRDGKLVIRPDSGDPVDIICGTMDYTNCRPEDNTFNWDRKNAIRTVQMTGVIELLWDEFGGTINEKGYKVLDSHIGAIYGDSITLDRAEQICRRLEAKGFCSTNIVLGIGSYTYQHNTRDTFGFAVKATYGEVKRHTSQDLDETGEISKKNFLDSDMEGYYTEYREIFKDPITDDGTKKSAKGLLKVQEVLEPDSYGKLHHNTYKLVDQVSKEEEQKGALKTVYKDGKLLVDWTLQEIRNRLNSHKIN